MVRQSPGDRRPHPSGSLALSKEHQKFESLVRYHIDFGRWRSIQTAQWTVRRGEMRTRLPVRITLERSEGSGRWASTVWEAVAVVPEGDSAVPDSRQLVLELHRKETEGYRTNLAADRAVYVVLRPGPDGTVSEPFLATVCPFEAQDYADDADSRVDAVPMPTSVAAWVTAFVRRHHVDEPFRKRKRGPRSSPESFARPPRSQR